MTIYGVFYKGKLQQTFKSIPEANKYVKKELKDPNCEALTISQLKEDKKHSKLIKREK